jgi:hypothetical protein
MPDGSEPRDIWTAKPPTLETTDIPRAVAPIHHEPELFLNLFSQTDLIFKRTTSETRTSGHREGSEPSRRGVDSTADKCPPSLAAASGPGYLWELGTVNGPRTSTISAISRRCSRRTLFSCRRVRFVDRPLRAMDRVRVQELHRHAPTPRAAEHLLEHPLQLP